MKMQNLIKNNKQIQVMSCLVAICSITILIFFTEDVWFTLIQSVTLLMAGIVWGQANTSTRLMRVFDSVINGPNKNI